MTDNLRAADQVWSDSIVGDSLQSLQGFVDAIPTGKADFLLDQEAHSAPNFTLHAAMALDHLRLLGRDEEDTNIRAIPHKGMSGPAFNGVFGWDLDRVEEWQRSGRGIYLQPNPGGTKVEEVKCGVALFIEFDDRPISDQVTLWIWLGLPEPSFQLLTGGKSVHTYWVLEAPISVTVWDALMARLIAFSGSDKSVKGANRMMRMAGGWYIDQHGTPTCRSEIINASERRYPAGDFDELLPPLPASPKPLSRKSFSAEPADLRTLIAALETVPQRVANTGTYSDYRNLAWGLVAAVEELGFSRKVAIDLLEDHSPSSQCGWDVEQVLTSGGDHIGPGSFWFQVKNLGGGRHA